MTRNTTPERPRPIAVPRTPAEIVDMLAEHPTRALLVGRSTTEALALFDDVVHAAREVGPFDELVSDVVRVKGSDRLRLLNGSTLKIAAALAPSTLTGHQYDIVLLAPLVRLRDELPERLAAALSSSPGGIIAWLPAVA